ncbi:hypothetical protein [Candidatus Mycoplasma haematominutum]|uniref:Uncharacterized protein n=1 Tax=Candidatus Mycoplasma haematominutum 'Birmingham 1' TaxID=1116213 RepID=G8C2J3_9MOLU|nr:hypothetical protein [Candidatus Mycoplasma haematominutum]CCE66541.1 hypothetical protein MHM_00230 [Candidatus Mycoplasma haematominutum 'Birmingham 1']
MVLKNKSIVIKVKKPGDIEAWQNNWKEELELELEELEFLEKEQKSKVSEMAHKGFSSLDIFRLRKLEELQKSKNYKFSLEKELNLALKQFTGIKPLKQECDRLNKKILDLKLVVSKLKEFDKQYFEEEKKY